MGDCYGPKWSDSQYVPFKVKGESVSCSVIVNSVESVGCSCQAARTWEFSEN